MGLVLRCRTSRSCLRKPSSWERPILGKEASRVSAWPGQGLGGVWGVGAEGQAHDSRRKENTTPSGSWGGRVGRGESAAQQGLAGEGRSGRVGPPVLSLWGLWDSRGRWASEGEAPRRQEQLARTVVTGSDL